MPSAAALRLQIERSLERRFPAALSPASRAIGEVLTTGILAVDAQLGGGLPVGAISEVTGPQSSGRTSLALRFVAQQTMEGSVCAWVDVNDAFDPESAAANGMILSQLLWARCSDAEVSRKPLTGKATVWKRLDQALRATDLLLQAGGFRAIVLDLGDARREQANRIPLATWFRFRQTADRTRCSLVVLGRAAYAQSAAAVVLECQSGRAVTAGETTVLRGFEFTLERRRERFEPLEIQKRKPPITIWAADAAWDTEKRA